MYRRAIISLKRALQLYKIQQNSKNLPPSNRYQCTLDGCILSDERTSTSTLTDDSNLSYSFISKRPIKIPTQGRTPMGPALLIIITYNLGLLNHLSAMGNSDRNGRRKAIRSAMASYNLAFETQGNLLQHNSFRSSNALTASIRSIRFKLMVINNMSQLHKLNSDKFNHDRCLKLLLSIIMVMVDQHVQALNTESKVAKLLRIELDGFLQNSSCLILKPKYTADAA